MKPITIDIGMVLIFILIGFVLFLAWLGLFVLFYFLVFHTAWISALVAIGVMGVVYWLFKSGKIKFEDDGYYY